MRAGTCAAQQRRNHEVQVSDPALVCQIGATTQRRVIQYADVFVSEDQYVVGLAEIANITLGAIEGALRPHDEEDEELRAQHSQHLQGPATNAKRTNLVKKNQFKKTRSNQCVMSQ